MHRPHITATLQHHPFKSSFLIHCIKFFWQGLVFLYVEKVEASLNGKNISHCTSKEEVFRHVLTLHSLLENPPGDYPDNLREGMVKGFVRIFSFMRYILRQFQCLVILLAIIIIC